MTYTENYELNQWQKSDRIMMEDFNADNAKIDTALKANADALATKANTSALTTLAGTIPKIAVGTYIGDDASAGKTITLAFPIKAVFVWKHTTHNGAGYSWPNAALCTNEADYPDDLIKISGSSFTVRNPNNAYPYLNSLNGKYNYVAFG